MGEGVMKTVRLPLAIAARMLFVSAFLVACTGGAVSTGPSATPATGEPTVSPTLSANPTAGPSGTPEPANATIKVYFLLEKPSGLVPVARQIADTDDMPAAALDKLLAGPTPDERSGVYAGRSGQFARLSSGIPAGTTALSVRVGEGLAIVDLSPEFATGGDDPVAQVARVAPIVYTLTQFPAVQGVVFLLNGASMDVLEGHEGSVIDGPARRDHFMDQLPPILVGQPAWGGTTNNPLVVSGRAQILADEFELALVDGASGLTLVHRTIRSDCAGCWSPPGGAEFEVSVPLPNDPFADLRLRVWATRDDGKPYEAIEYPLR